MHGASRFASSLLVSAFALVQPVPLAAQVAPTPQSTLTPGASVRNTLAAGASHSWQLTAAADRFIVIEVETSTVDVMVRVLDAAGQLVREIDGPGAEGVETARWLTDAAGEWTVHVVPFEAGGTGEYQIDWVIDRAPTPEDRSTLRLDSLADAFRVAHSEGTPEGRERANALTREAVLLYQTLGDRVGEANALSNIGHGLSNIGQPDSALAYYSRALPIQRAIGDRSGEASTLTNIGYMHHVLGRVDSALVRYAEALPVFRGEGDTSGESRTLTFAGMAHLLAGRPDSALFYYTRALTIQQVTGDRSGEALTLNNIGDLNIRLARPDSALAFFARALPIQRAILDRQAEAATLGNTGLVYAALGRFDSALVYMTQALPIWRAIGNRSGEATTLSNIGAMHRRLGRPDSAIAYYALALPVRRAIQDRAGEASTLNGIGMVQIDLHRPDSALAYYAQALAIQRDIADRQGEGTTYTNIGYAHSVLDRPDSALAFYADGLQIQRAIGDRSSEAVTLGNIAFISHRGLSPPSLSAAVAYYDSAAWVRSIIGQRAGSDPNRISYAEQHEDLFRQWSLAWLRRRDEAGRDQGALAALAAAERGRAQALLDLMRGGSDAGVAPGADMAAEGERLAQHVSSSGSSALYYVVTSDTLLIWLIGPSGVEVFRRDVTEQALTADVAALRRGLGADSAAVRARLALRDAPDLEAPGDGVGIGIGFAAAARRLSAQLLPPELLEKLPPGELVIIPHGSLNLVPFAALTVDVTGEPLGARYAVRYAPSLATLVQFAQSGDGASTEVRSGALVVGNPTMPRVRSYNGTEITLGSLSGAEAEAQWIAGQVGTTLLRGGEATEAEVKQRLPSARLVHLATHGYAYSSEARVRDSFIALAPTAEQDGLLTVGEVLDEVESLSADLVVLSACQTGLGDLKHAEGTVGLQRAFLAKGARSVLVSLWSVSDEATEQLMRRFYTHWLNGSGKAEALRRAQSEVRGERGSRFHDPRYWAAFQLVGAR